VPAVLVLVLVVLVVVLVLVVVVVRWHSFWALKLSPGWHDTGGGFS
jgi:H+/gluconate symporter-like permease